MTRFPRCSVVWVAIAAVAPAVIVPPVTALSQTPASSPPGAAPVSADRVNGWRYDIAFWLNQLRKQHYVYRSKPLPSRLIKAADELSRNVPRYSDERVLFEMQRLAAHGATAIPMCFPSAHSAYMEVLFRFAFIFFRTDCSLSTRIRVTSS